MSDQSFLESYQKILCICAHRSTFQANIYLFKANNKGTKTTCKTCSNWTIKTPERRRWRCSVVFIVNLQHISRLVPMFLLLIWTGNWWVISTIFLKYIIENVLLKMAALNLDKKHVDREIFMNLCAKNAHCRKSSFFIFFSLRLLIKNINKN